MVDSLNPDVPDQPVVVPASPVGDQVATFSRDFVILASALPALIAVLGTHDVKQITDYLTSQAFAPALGVIVLAGTLGYRQWKARKRHTDDVRVAKAAPDSIAIVKGN